jgi:hypothetical protein
MVALGSLTMRGLLSAQCVGNPKVRWPKGDDRTARRTVAPFADRHPGGAGANHLLKRAAASAMTDAATGAPRAPDMHP